MFNINALLEYLSSTEGLHTITLSIIIVGAINAIFITYSVRTTYGMARKEKEQLKKQQAKIDKLFPKQE